jgi:hypothetical protein
MKYTIVYTSAYVFDIDIAREALKNANVPFYVQTETLAGVRQAFPASPASGFGTRWHVFVPSKVEREAKKVLSTLHLTIDSDMKPFPIVTPKQFKDNLWKALVVVVPIIVVLGYALCRAVTRH